MDLPRKMHRYGARGEWLVWVLGVVVIMLVVGTGKQVVRRYEIEQEKRLLGDDISSLRIKQTELLQLLAYTQSPIYTEEQARLRLNLAHPGERLAILETPTATLQTESEQTVLAKQQAATPNPTRWWQYFFIRSEP